MPVLLFLVATVRRFLLLIAVLASPLHASTRVVLLHFSDYHSHALPFYSEGKRDQGGIARAIGYLRAAKRGGALVFDGGDMINKGSPSWSDKYECVEWPWFNGIVDAMALGNHDMDYGLASFDRCRGSVTYPILSANTKGFPAYRVFTVGGVRIGVFAVAGRDFSALVKAPGFEFADSVSEAAAAVRALKEVEHADAVVLIGHESTADDAALAAKVPGIDVIFGTHSHEKHPLTRIEGTATWFIAPSQYLTYISRLELTFDRHKLVSVSGGLIAVDRHLPADGSVTRRVRSLQRELERDPQYASRFASMARRSTPLEVGALARATVETMRSAANADAALSTSSSFRQALPAGAITMEDLRCALPYDNEIVVAEMRGDELEALIAASENKRGTDDYAYVVKPPQIDAGKTYRVAATDFIANVNATYRHFFTHAQRTGLHVREEFRKALVARPDALR